MDACLEDGEVLHFLRERAAEAKVISSVCTGALLLGAAGLLRGYRATTHWLSLDLLQPLGAHPVSERHGLAWYELDLNWIGISTLRMLGLAWDVKVAKIRQPLPEEEAA